VLELGDRAEDLKEHSADRRRRVDALVEHDSSLGRLASLPLALSTKISSQPGEFHVEGRCSVRDTVARRKVNI